MNTQDRAQSARRARSQLSVRFTRPLRAALSGMLLLLLLLFGSWTAVSAHEGHDHDKPPPLNLPIAPRVTAVTPDYELVGVLSGEGRLTIFLHRYATGEPIANAQLALSAAGADVEAKAREPGVFEAVAPWISAKEPVDIVFKLTLPDDQDILTGRLEAGPLAQPATSTPAPATLQLDNSVYLGAGAFMVGVLLTLLISARVTRRRTAQPKLPKAPADSVPDEQKVKQLRAALVVPILLVLSLPLDRALAETAPLPSVPPTMATDAPQRMSDGTLFVPKATQHLLAVRTVIAEESKARRTTQLAGTIIADPNGLARVQTGHAGRVEAPDGGLAFVGKRVAKGDLLARLTHHIEAFDKGTLQGEIAELEARIATQEIKLGLYMKAPLAVPRIKIEEAKGELQALRKKREQLVPTIAETEEVRAPMSGVVSASNVVPGQVVDAREIMFEIVDPNRFWVEAIAHDVAVAANLSSAVAVIGSGEKLPLEFAGLGLTLKHQAAPLSFRLAMGKPNLSIGKPVTVILQSANEVTGIVVPSSSLLRAQSGLPIVWVKTEPERFEPRVVRVEPLDGDRVTLLGGVMPDDRVVTEGATLLNQIR
jgi:cobalt-zinc-cadmium efflux system membrane fusion protein